MEFITDNMAVKKHFYSWNVFEYVNGSPVFVMSCSTYRVAIKICKELS